MAQHTQIILTDDIDGNELAAGKGESVRFALDGHEYEIDLSDKNAAALRKTLTPYLNAGRKVRADGRAGTRRTQVGPDARTIKEWARANGYEVSDRGRVSNEIREAFAAAN